MKNIPFRFFSVLGLTLLLTSCSKNDDMKEMTSSTTITIENVLNSKPLVQSGTFRSSGETPEIGPGESVSFKFSAGKGQTITFATMYGWSNDLFFAPENTGIRLYADDGTPIQGDVSEQIKLWDNGTRINQPPGMQISQPGVAETTVKNIKEVDGIDDQGNIYPAAKELLNASLHYDGNSLFTLTLKNTSNNTANSTPFSPGVWAMSYIVGSNLLNSNIIFEVGKPSVNGLTNLSEMGDITSISNYLTEQTGIFTPLSPVLVVVYNGIENPIYKADQKDAGKGLKKLAQMGNASELAEYLKTLKGVKSVYVLSANESTVLLPKVGSNEGGKVSQKLNVLHGDRIAIASMYGFSNDWFFASKNNGVDALQKGDISNNIGLFDNGTIIDQFPGASNSQINLDDSPITEVPNPNTFTTLPLISNIIKVILN